MTLAISEANESLHASLKETEKARTSLEEKSKALAQSNRDLENFASIAAHDMAEPLRKVRMFGERLADHSGPSLDEKGNQYLAVMVSGASRLQALLNSLLEYSRVNSKGGEFVNTDLNAVLNDVQNDLAELIRDNAAEIHIDKLPAINADYTQMRQLFQNLIANALRYHKPDVAPVITIRFDEEHSPEAHSRIVVSDNGIGFSQENAEKIFDVFQRLHTRAEYPGTGMGLAVCRRIMERHKGRISAEAEVGVGASFNLDFLNY